MGDRPLIHFGRSNHSEPGSEITSERDYPDERSTMQVENVTVECKDCGRLPG